MDFATSVRTCLVEKYATFKGRASRSEYWWFVLAYVIAVVLVGIVSGLTGLFFLQWILVLALICPSLAAGFRRLQDTGRPGWYILIPAGLSLVGMLFAPEPIEMEPGQIPTEMPNIGGTIFFSLIGIVQLVLVVIFIWWLTRPSQPETNFYGPPPQA